jgi:hypothetical protein
VRMGEERRRRRAPPAPIHPLRAAPAQPGDLAPPAFLPKDGAVSAMPATRPLGRRCRTASGPPGADAAAEVAAATDGAGGGEAGHQVDRETTAHDGCRGRRVGSERTRRRRHPRPGRASACTSGCRRRGRGLDTRVGGIRLLARHLLGRASTRRRVTVLPRVRADEAGGVRDAGDLVRAPAPPWRRLGSGRGSGIAYRDLDRTVDGLGRDGAAYRRLIARSPRTRRGRPVHGVDAPARATASVRHGPLRHPRSHRAARCGTPGSRATSPRR